MNTISGWLVCLTIATTLHAAEPSTSGNSDPFPKPDPTSAKEAIAEHFSYAKAAEYLDRSTMAWFRERQCASCHSTYSFIMARPMLGDLNAPVLVQMRDYLDGRIAGWDRGGPGAGLPKEEDEAVTEIVATGATLAFYDAQTTGKLRTVTKQALDRMWTVQRADGSWDWNKHQLPPQELDEYYGGVFAALGVGYAPDNYATSAAAKEGVARLKQYFKKNPAPNLHHKLFLLWASLKLDGLMTDAERSQTIKDVLTLQRRDGGWNLPSLGDWPRLNGKPNDVNAPSDGYATGLVVYILRQAGRTPKDEALQRGLTWLQTNQRVSGRWYTRSLNADRAHYITNAGTAYAVLALKSCGVADK
jgi:squalene-hopene/tetraprenyl-beta-curcumene cyclase